MDLDILKQHLKQAEEHVAVGQKHIARQREIIAELEADGHDVTDSRRLLQLFEEVQCRRCMLQVATGYGGWWRRQPRWLTSVRRFSVAS